MSGSAVALMGADVSRLRLDQLAEWRDWVRSADAEGALDAANKARIARELMKAVKAAEALIEQALLLECDALRRLGQLGATSALSKVHRICAVDFAALSDAEYAAMLTEFSGWTTPYGLRNRRAKERDWRRRLDEMEQARTQGRTTQPVEPTQEDIEHVRRAAVTLCGEMAAGGSFTTNEAAEALARALDMEIEFREEALAAEGITEVVRQALMHQSSRHGIEYARDGASLTAPCYVTYEEAEHGWMRVSWFLASREQFRLMVQHREAQAQAMRTTADQLAALLAVMDSAGGRDEGMCHELMQRGGAEWEKKS